MFFWILLKFNCEGAVNGTTCENRISDIVHVTIRSMVDVIFYRRTSVKCVPFILWCNPDISDLGVIMTGHYIPYAYLSYRIETQIKQRNTYANLQWCQL